MNEYYVYEWIRLDTNEPFYVGKGKGNRCYKTNRTLASKNSLELSTTRQQTIPTKGRTDFEHIGIYKKLAVEKCSKQSTDNNAYCK